MREMCKASNIPMGQAAIAWVVAQPSVVSVLAGATSEKQITENCEALNLHLSSDFLDQLTNASEKVKEALNYNTDMWAARIS
jgi:aryl-alcohol dehydrogenase-like predicted oxidoreductase